MFSLSGCGHKAKPFYVQEHSIENNEVKFIQKDKSEVNNENCK